MTDYIEREAAIEKVKEERNYVGKFSFEEEHGWSVGFHQGISFALSDIASIPAADVRPVVRGTWKVSAHKTYYDVSCSVCGINSFFQVDEKDSVSYANFCPNCGADMREES